MQLRTIILLSALAVLAALGWRAYHRAPEPVSVIDTPQAIIVVGPGEEIRIAPKPPVVTGKRPTKPVPLRKPSDLRVARKPAATNPPVWTLPWSCADVKWYNSHFSAKVLETMRIAAGVAKPTADQMRQIKQCLAS